MYVLTARSSRLKRIFQLQSARIISVIETIRFIRVHGSRNVATTLNFTEMSSAVRQRLADDEFTFNSI